MNTKALHLTIMAFTPPENDTIAELERKRAQTWEIIQKGYKSQNRGWLGLMPIEDVTIWAHYVGAVAMGSCD